jgi:Derlin-2/3
MDQWLREIPVVTRTYMIAALLTTAACTLELVSPFSLYYSWRQIIHKYQFWRLLTNFFFFGARFSLDFLFHMFFLVRYCRALEEGSFRGRTADFVWMVFFGAITMLILAPFINLQFLGSSLTFMMVYVWGRRNPFGRMNFLGLFTFTAPYLPWVLFSFSYLLGNDGSADLLGIGVGHTYYFLEDVFPRMLPAHPRLLKTPRLVQLLFSGGGDVIHDDVVPQPGDVVNLQHDAAVVGAADNIAQNNAAANANNGQNALDNANRNANADAANNALNNNDNNLLNAAGEQRGEI